jgi:hypothetical protein
VHSTRSSGGELTPEQLAAAARVAGLDFIATTEHNTADTHAEWSRYAGEDLLVILGQEATTRTGHWLALGIQPGQVVEWQYGVEDGQIDRHLDEVHQAGGLCVAAHPYAPYPSGVFEYPYVGFDVVEVWPWPSGVEAWRPTFPVGVGGRRWATATPIWRARSAYPTASCWPRS